jgi:hypothetical protein
MCLLLLQLWDESHYEDRGDNTVQDVDPHDSNRLRPKIVEYNRHLEQEDDDEYPHDDDSSLSVDTQLIIFQFFERLYSFKYAKQGFKKLPMSKSVEGPEILDWTDAIDRTIECSLLFGSKSLTHNHLNKFHFTCIDINSTSLCIFFFFFLYRKIRRE